MDENGDEANFPLFSAKVKVAKFNVILMSLPATTRDDVVTSGGARGERRSVRYRRLSETGV